MKNSIHNSYECIEDIFNLPDADVTDINYPTDTKTLEPLHKGQHNIIKVCNAYVQFQTHDNEPIGHDCVKVTNGNFDKFSLQAMMIFRRFCMAGIVNTRANSTTLYSIPNYLVENFKTSIKCGPTLFPIFKDQTLWDNWNCNYTATACTKDVEHILHKAYIPLTPDSMALLKGKQNICTQFLLK